MAQPADQWVPTGAVLVFYLSVPVVASLFLEDVTAWRELHDIRFTPNVKFTGRSGTTTRSIS